jgi:hypothetical protein
MAAPSPFRIGDIVLHPTYGLIIVRVMGFHRLHFYTSLLLHSFKGGNCIERSTSRLLNDTNPEQIRYYFALMTYDRSLPAGDLRHIPAPSESASMR